jgi:hypothetical protein
LNLGTIDKSGFVDTGPSTWWGRSTIGRKYNDTLAALIGGLVSETRNGESAVRTAAGKMPTLYDFLPAHAPAWINAMEQYIKEIMDMARED